MKTIISLSAKSEVSPTTPAKDAKRVRLQAAFTKISDLLKDGSMERSFTRYSTYRTYTGVTDKQLPKLFAKILPASFAEATKTTDSMATAMYGGSTPAESTKISYALTGLENEHSTPVVHMQFFSFGKTKLYGYIVTMQTEEART